MGNSFTEGQKVVTSDDHTIGTVVGERGDCVLVQTGHVFHSTHAIPRSFVHEFDGELRATVAKEIVDASPKVDDGDWDCDAVLVHYGLAGPYEVDPDPDGPANAEIEGQRAGVDPAPAQRVRTLGELERPAEDPAAVTTNLRKR
jgi:hypothetical protein